MESTAASFLQPLTDSFGRQFSYLRLSITDACNFKCVYCLPNGYCRTDGEDFLSPVEIERLVGAMAELGMWKVRLTGGEPTVRRDFLEIVERVARAPGVRRVAVSTNGYRLKALAEELARLGVSAVNVSVDSLDAAVFREITGQDRLRDVLEGIDAAVAAGLRVKTNAVLLRGKNDGALQTFLDFVRERPVSARFIELMRTAENTELFRDRHASAAGLREELFRQGWRVMARADASGPAEELAHPDYAGTIGFIAPYSSKFCDSCNRLRVSARGELRMCLFGEGQRTLRGFLASEDSREELQSTVRKLLGSKEISHFLEENRFGDMKTFSSIGG